MAPYFRLYQVSSKFCRLYSQMCYKKVHLTKASAPAVLRKIHSCSRTCYSSKGIIELNNENEVSSCYVNRNPCNLEQMFMAHKTSGYELDSIICRYWYRLEFEKIGRNVLSRVVHHTGRIVVSASSGESGIKGQLYSSSDYSAASNLGSVMAQRCLESGIHFVVPAFSYNDDKKISQKGFIESFEAGGIKLFELEPYKVLGINEIG